MVEPAVALALEATLVSVRSALEATERVAVAVLELVPTEVDKEPEGIVLVTVPVMEPVTTLVSVQLSPGGINVPVDKVSEPAPATAVATPALQLVCATEVALTKPAGYASVKIDESVAEAKTFVFVIVMVNNVVPPAFIEAEEKLFATVGRDGVTTSTSEAEHTPAVHEPETLVLETLEGGAIVATLVTCCCA